MRPKPLISFTFRAKGIVKLKNPFFLAAAARSCKAAGVDLPTHYKNMYNCAQVETHRNKKDLVVFFQYRKVDQFLEIVNDCWTWKDVQELHV